MKRHFFPWGLRLVIVSVIVIVIASAFIFCLGGVCANNPEFSAEIVITDAKGKTDLGKIYVKGYEKIRQEIMTDGESTVTILRLDKKVSWTLLPEKQYMEVKLPFNPNQPNPDLEYEVKELGRETVNGYLCKIMEYTYKNKKYGVLTQWYSEELGYAIKIESKDGKAKTTSVVEYKNIETGNQEDFLFEIPAGYSKFSLPFKLPGM